MHTVETQLPRPFSTILLLTLAALVSVYSSACSDDHTKKCTLLACANAVNLTFQKPDGSMALFYSGQITVGDAVIDIDCTETDVPHDDYVCFTGGELQIASEEIPNQIVIDIQESESADNLGYVGTLAVQKTESRPNGPDCEPLCHSGDVAVQLEAL